MTVAVEAVPVGDLAFDAANGHVHLFPVHLRDNASKLGRFLDRQTVDRAPQSAFADGTDPVHGNFSILPCTL